MKAVVADDRLRNKIAEILKEDLSQQIQSAGYDDSSWSSDVCDNTASRILDALFHKDFHRLDNRMWIVRYVSHWTIDD